MANLDKEVLAIQEIAQSGDIEQAFRETELLFFRLVQGDSVFILPSATLLPDVLAKKAFCPFTAPIDGDVESGDTYIRIFSDKELIEKFAFDHDVDDSCITEITGIEMIQLAKYWFMRGTFGFLLNDCAEWITISLPDFLRVIYNELIGQPQKYNQEFVDLVRFIHKCNGVYTKVYLVSEAGKHTIQMDDDEVYFFVDEQMSVNYNGEQYVLEEVSIRLLKTLIFEENADMERSICISTIDGAVSSTLEKLQFAYASVMYSEEVGYA